MLAVPVKGELKGHSKKLTFLSSPIASTKTFSVWREATSEAACEGVLAAKPCLCDVLPIRNWQEGEKPATDLASFTRSAKSIFLLFKMAATMFEFWASLETNFIRKTCTLQATLSARILLALTVWSDFSFNISATSWPSTPPPPHLHLTPLDSYLVCWWKGVYFTVFSVQTKRKI